LAAYARFEGETLVVEALIADPSGEPLLREKLEGPPSQAEEMGRYLAEELLSRGGREILEKVYGREA
jgi:hydroxymethylbilane synthase